MKIQMELSLYPLRQNDLIRPIREFVKSLKDDNIYIKTGPMSSVVSGASQEVFQSLHKAFDQVAQKYEVVLTAKISNACPEIE